MTTLLDSRDYMWNIEIDGVTLETGLEKLNQPAKETDTWFVGTRLKFNTTERYWEVTGTTAKGNTYGVALAEKSNGELTGDIKILPVTPIPCMGSHDIGQKIENMQTSNDIQGNLDEKFRANKTIAFNNRETTGTFKGKTPVSVKKLPDETWDRGDDVIYYMQGRDENGTSYAGYWSNSTTTINITGEITSSWDKGNALPAISGDFGLITSASVASDPWDLWNNGASSERYPPHPNHIKNQNVTAAIISGGGEIFSALLSGKNGSLNSESRENNIATNKFTFAEHTLDGSDLEKIPFYQGIYSTNPSDEGKIHGMMNWFNGYMRVGSYSAVPYWQEEGFGLDTNDVYRSNFNRWVMHVPSFIVSRHQIIEENFTPDSNERNWAPMPFSKTFPAATDPYGKLTGDITITWFPVDFHNIEEGNIIEMVPIISMQNQQDGSKTWLHTTEDFCGTDFKTNLGKDVVRTYSEINNGHYSYYKDPVRGTMRQKHNAPTFNYGVMPNEQLNNDGSRMWDYQQWSGSDYQLWKYIGNQPAENPSYPFNRVYESADYQGQFFVHGPTHDDPDDTGFDTREVYWKLQRNNYNITNKNRTWEEVTTSWQDITSNRFFDIPQTDGTPKTLWEIPIADVLALIPWWDDLSLYRIQYRTDYWSVNSQGDETGPTSRIRTSISLNNFWAAAEVGFGGAFGFDGWFCAMPQGVASLSTMRFSGGNSFGTSDPSSGAPFDAVAGTAPILPAIQDFNWQNENNPPTFSLTRDNDEQTLLMGSGSTHYTLTDDGYMIAGNTTQGKKMFIWGSCEIEGRDGKFYSATDLGDDFWCIGGMKTRKTLDFTSNSEDAFGGTTSWEGDDVQRPSYQVKMLDYDYKIKGFLRACGDIENDILDAHMMQWADIGSWEVTIPKLENVDLSVDDAIPDPIDPLDPREQNITIDVSSTAEDDLYPPNAEDRVTATVTYKDDLGNVLLTDSNVELISSGENQWDYSGTAPAFVGSNDGTIKISVNYDYSNYSFVPDASNEFILPFTPQSTGQPTLSIINISGGLS